tara:strand:+ start:11797 stop:12870 length:1074 start_codon:yes stop_codon:yes gene_type:complete
LKSISFIICSNGFGHTKRSAKVLNELINRNLKFSFNVICNSSRIDFLKSNIKSKLKRIKINTSLMENEPNWLKFDKLNFSQYIEWASKFKFDKTLLNSDLIVSDNHVAPLINDKKTILMGSFLWLDVINNYNKKPNKISEYEKSILKRYSPEMIAVDNMYNETVRKNTRIFPVPWFESRRVYEKFILFNNILITSGGTEELDLFFIKLVKRLAYENNSKNFFLDSKLIRKLKTKSKSFLTNIFEFDFSEESFKKIDVAICRPGIGILTDCMSYIIPVIAVSNNKNSEIIFNSKKVVSKGIGISIMLDNKDIEDKDYIRINNYINSRDKLNDCIEEIKSQKMDGHILASEKIINEVLK